MEVNINELFETMICPDCGKELHNTYLIKIKYEVGEDCRNYGVICCSCGFEQYE
jgi:RNase P subunit RPR2